MGFINISKFCRVQTIAIFSFLVVLFVSCKEKKTIPSVIGQSSGAINSVTIIINDMLWNGEIGDSLRKKLAAPVDGLPQEEPLFTINQYPMKAIDGGKINNRNIIIIKKEDRNVYEFKSDEFAKPQNVVHISGNSTESILSHIQQNADGIIRNFKQTEIIANQKNIRFGLQSDATLSKKFKISIDIPKDYQYALIRSNFVWLKKEMVSGNNSLLVYTVPFKTLLKDNNTGNNIVAMRDSIEGNYIKSRTPNSRMVTENSYAPYFQSIILDKKRAFETKGTWELKGDFMSGSFINYAIMDRTKRRFVIIEGLCYAPSTKKRDLMFELEAIIKTLQILK